MGSGSKATSGFRPRSVSGEGTTSALSWRASAPTSLLRCFVVR
ncbi:MAG: hypothetical protein WAL61_06145 [Acidimicrobiales bacterium]